MPKSTALLFSLAALLLAAVAPSAAAADAVVTKHTDPSGTVSISLPPGFDVVKSDKQDSTLSKFKGTLETVGGARRAAISIQIQDRFVRAALALELPYMRRDDREIRGSRSSGTGYAQVAVRPERGEWVDWRRALERNGVVYVATIRVEGGIADAPAELVQPLFDSIAVAEIHVPGTLPTGEAWAEWESDGVRVQSDLKRKGRANVVARDVAVARKLLADSLEGDPFVTTPPVVRVFADGDGYLTQMRAAGASTTRSVQFVPALRCIAIDLSAEKAKGFSKKKFTSAIRREAGLQYAFDYFGGTVPMWVGTGLSLYTWIGVESGARPDKPKTGYVKQGQLAILGACPLPEWFDVWWSEVDNKVQAGYVLWSWHWFLRHAKEGEAYRPAYEKYVKALRLTGSPSVAALAWKDVDPDAMLRDFRLLADKWK